MKRRTAAWTAATADGRRPSGGEGAWRRRRSARVKRRQRFVIDDGRQRSSNEPDAFFMSSRSSSADARVMFSREKEGRGWDRGTPPLAWIGRPSRHPSSRFRPLPRSPVLLPAPSPAAAAAGAPPLPSPPVLLKPPPSFPPATSPSAQQRTHRPPSSTSLVRPFPHALEIGAAAQPDEAKSETCRGRTCSSAPPVASLHLPWGLAARAGRRATGARRERVARGGHKARSSRLGSGSTRLGSGSAQIGRAHV